MPRQSGPVSTFADRPADAKSTQEIASEPVNPATTSTTTTDATSPYSPPSGSTSGSYKPIADPDVEISLKSLGVTGVPRTVIATGLSMGLSVVGYWCASPYLVPGLRDVATEIKEVPGFAPLATRFLEVAGLALTEHTNWYDAGLLAFLGKIPHLHLLHSNFNVDLSTLAFFTILDLACLLIPLFLCFPQRFPGRSVIVEEISPARKVKVEKDHVLTTLLSLLASTILSITIYTASKTFFPGLLLTHLKTFRTLVAIPLPLLIAGLLPAGYAFQEIVTKHGLVSGWWHVMAAIAVVSGTGIYYGVRGVDGSGVVGVLSSWVAATILAALGLSWAAEVPVLG
ncbi:hypothetical protein YB2330_004830 [Saitoella coloradoensis]